MFESAEPNSPSMPTASLITAPGLTYSSSTLSVTRMPFFASSDLSAETCFLHALLIGRQGIDKVVEGRATIPPTISRTVIMPATTSSTAKTEGTAFPLEPEHRRRPEHSEENGDKEGHQDRLRLIDAPDDDHERRRDYEEARFHAKNYSVQSWTNTSSAGIRSVGKS